MQLHNACGSCILSSVKICAVFKQEAVSLCSVISIANVLCVKFESVEHGVNLALQDLVVDGV
jgi:hypothetical protein